MANCLMKDLPLTGRCIISFPTFNVYRALRFPNGIYDHITGFHEEQAETEAE
jgi:hypothetical protein